MCSAAHGPFNLKKKVSLNITINQANNPTGLDYRGSGVFKSLCVVGYQAALANVG